MTHMRTTRLIIIAVLLGAGAFAAEPFLGTWKLNIARSKFSPGPAPKSGVVRVERQGRGYKVSIETVDAKGKSQRSSYASNLDGKDVAFTGSEYDTIVLERSTENKIVLGLKKGGKMLVTGTNEVSRDGKTRTMTLKGTSIGGKPLNTILVYDRI